VDKARVEELPSAADGNRKTGSAEVVGSIHPPCPLFPVMELRHWFEFILNNCRTNSAAISVSYPNVCAHVTTVLIINTLTDEI
jgi:hypothetical protein